MKIYTVYRCLYGEDFIKPSLLSIKDVSDKIFVFWTDIPFGNIKSCIYRGKEIIYPKNIDNVVAKIEELKLPNLNLMYDYYENSPDNQVTHLINDLILPDNEKPDIIIFMEPDMVWRKDQLNNAIEEFINSDNLTASSRQVELWREVRYVIPERQRTSSIFFNMNKLNMIPRTGFSGNAEGMGRLNYYVHNFGFCISEINMYWKHVLSIGFSKVIGDSCPNEDWYEDKWLKWDIEKNNYDLEISEGYEHLIPYANFYNSIELPEVIREIFI
jgi:hypothetical protein